MTFLKIKVCIYVYDTFFSPVKIIPISELWCSRQWNLC